MGKVSAAFFSVGITGAFDSAVADANHKKAISSFKKIASKCGVEPVICEDILYNRKSLNEFLEKSLSKGVRLIVLHTASFTAGEMGQQTAWFAKEHSLPVLVWGVPEKSGGPLTVNNLCCTNFMTSICHALKVPYKWIWAAPGTDDAVRELTATLKSIKAISKVRNSQLIIVGSSRVPGFYGSNYDETALKGRYGVHTERVPLTELYKLFKAARGKEVEKVVSRINDIGANCACDGTEIEKTAKMYCALKKIADDNEAAGLAVRCWPEVRDDLVVETCLPMGMLCEDGVLCSCEADIPGLLSMQFQWELTDGKFGPPTLLDMVSINETTKSVGLWHCGVGAPSLYGKGGVDICRHNIVKQFDTCANMGLVSEGAMKPGDATVFRLQGDCADRYLSVPGKVLKKKPGFKGTYAEFKPEQASARSLLATVMSQGITHHYSLAYSDHSAMLEEVAYWLGVKKIEMEPDGPALSGFGSL